MKNFRAQSALVLTAVGLLAGCGGGSTGPEAFTSLTQATGSDATVYVLVNDTGGRATSSASGTYRYADATASIGTVDYGLDAESILSTDQTGTRYKYVAGLSGGTDYKILALQTAAADMPSGTVTYLGQSTVVVVDGSSFSGSMDSTVTANFADSDVTVVLDNISNFSNGGDDTPTGTETITFTALPISGATFVADENTTVSIVGFTAPNIPSNTEGANISVSGVFAGDQAEEVAGVAYVDGGVQAIVSLAGTSE